MTDRLYTREEMVKAFKAGVNWTPDPPGTARTRSPKEHNQVFLEAVERYVDSLQAMRGTDQDARGKSQDAEKVPAVQSDQERLHPTLRERLLKIEARQFCLARAMGVMGKEILVQVEFRSLERAGFFADAFAGIAGELNTYFPELTEEK